MKLLIKKHKWYILIALFSIIYVTFRKETNLIFARMISPFKKQFRITSGLGYRIDPVTKKQGAFHNGVDFATPIGTPIYAPFDGTVSTYRDDQNGNALILLNDTMKRRFGFAHLSEWVVKTGRVKQGDLLAYTGSTGKSTGPHVHVTLKDTLTNKWLDLTKEINL